MNFLNLFNSEGLDFRGVISFFYAFSKEAKEARKIIENFAKAGLIDKSILSKLKEVAKKDIIEVAKGIKDRKTRMWIYRQIFFIAFEDKKIVPSERKTLRRLAEVLGLSETEAKEIEDWVKKFVKLNSEWERMK